jgi:hypothetical protein
VNVQLNWYGRWGAQARGGLGQCAPAYTDRSRTRPDSSQPPGSESANAKPHSEGSRSAAASPARSDRELAAAGIAFCRDKCADEYAQRQNEAQYRPK